MIRLSIILLLIGISNTKMVAQNLKFSNTGLVGISIGQNLKNIDLFKYDLLENRKSNSAIFYSPNTTSNFYYVISDSLILEDCIPVTQLFFTTDLTGYVNTIFIFVANVNEMIFEKINTAFGVQKLQSNSSISNISTNSKSYWKLDNIRTLLTNYGSKRSVKISIVNVDSDLGEPSISLYDTLE